MPEDKRIVKTRFLLRSTLQKLMENNSFDDITVKQVCENADVSRVTFYSHFTDKYALLANLYGDFLNKVVQRCIDKCRKAGEKDDARAYCVNLYVSYAEEIYAGRLDFFRSVFKEKSYAYIAFVEFIERATEEFIDKLNLSFNTALSRPQMLSLLYHGPMDYLKSIVFTPGINSVEAAAMCRDYYCVIIDFALKNNSDFPAYTASESQPQ